MSSVRQNNLYAVGDWKVVYNAFRNVNLQAYDYKSIYDSLVQYIRINNPEEFNDYVRHSEMMVHINMIAYLGQSLAFRIDLNARENFFDTAERRESVLKLAKMLSYKPKRNRTANGLCKIVSIKTTQPILNSRGESLSQREIVWNQQNNLTWYDDFIRVINSAMSSTNRFGDPVKDIVLDSINTELYSLSSVKNSNIVYPFSSPVNGTNYNFEVVSANIDDTNNTFTEDTPDPESMFNILYRNDKNGVTSPNNGFFVYFKEGELAFNDYQYDSPEKDREELIDRPNINETDIWVQEIDSNGNVLDNWTKVPSLVGQNIIYNNLFLNEQNIYATETTNDNNVIIRYSDGDFGNVPLGRYRVWYRTSVNESYIIRPNDISNKSITIPYYGSDNQIYQLTVKFSLLVTVDNAEPEENIEDIRTNAPLSYYTQDRMVNGEDYNVYPITQTNLIRKIKTVNRTHAGHSRFIDIQDPTGAHSNINVMGDDGYIIKEPMYKSQLLELQYNTNYSSLVYSHIENLLNSYNFRMFYYHDLRRYILDDSTEIGGHGSEFLSIDANKIIWKTLPNNNTSNTGYFVDENGTNILVEGSGNTDFRKMIRENTKLFLMDSNGNEYWTTIKSVNAGGLVDTSYMVRGNIELSSHISNDCFIVSLVPGLRGYLNDSETTLVVDEMTSNRSFGLWYDYINDSWNLITQDNILNTGNKFDFYQPQVPSDKDNRWLIKAIIENREGDVYYNFEVRGTRFIFGSDKQVRFFFKNNTNIIDSDTGNVVSDYVKILESNTDRVNLNQKTSTARAVIGKIYTLPIHSQTTAYNITLAVHNSEPINNVKFFTLDNREITSFTITQSSSGTIVRFSDVLVPNNTVTVIKISNITAVNQITGVYNNKLKHSYDFSLVDKYIRNDGTIDYSKVLIEPIDVDKDGVADYPLAFEDIVDMSEKIFFKSYNDFDNNVYDKVATDVVIINNDINNIIGGVVYYCNDDITINDIHGNPVHYLKDNFYKGIPKVVNTEQNRADIIQNGIDVDGTRYSWYTGRSYNNDEQFYFQWKHYAGIDDRIDPSISNIMDMSVLMKSYDTAVRTWLKNKLPVEDFPITPSSNELKNNLRFIELNKSTSDQIIYIPAEYKLLFGASALPEYRAKFKVVKAMGTSLTDNEIKSRIINTFEEFFNIDNWQFGDTFYYTELAAFVHSKLIGIISSMVIVPENNQSVFGDLFEISSEPNELFLSTASVDNIDIVKTYTDSNIKRR